MEDFYTLKEERVRLLMEPFVIAVVGAGGKTSLIRHMAGEAQNENKKVLVVTTTHMYKPVNYGIFTNSLPEVQQALNKENLVVVGLPDINEKIKFCGEEFYKKSCPWADVVLIEADGAKGFPLKVPASHEPVIPDNATMILCLTGLSAWGKLVKEVCFRHKEAKEILQKKMPKSCWNTARVDENILACLLKHGYVEPLRKQYPCAVVVPVLNQADTEELQVKGKQVLDNMKEPDGWIMGNLQYSTYAKLF